MERFTQFLGIFPHHCFASLYFYLFNHVLVSLYTYDMRFLERPVMVHMDHVSAVLDVDYSPTGKEFVSASFDKTIRIFPKDGSHSRSVTTVCKEKSINFYKVGVG